MFFVFEFSTECKSGWRDSVTRRQSFIAFLGYTMCTVLSRDKVSRHERTPFAFGIGSVGAWVFNFLLRLTALAGAARISARARERHQKK